MFCIVVVVMFMLFVFGVYVVDMLFIIMFEVLVSYLCGMLIECLLLGVLLLGVCKCFLVILEFGDWGVCGIDVGDFDQEFMYDQVVVVFVLFGVQVYGDGLGLLFVFYV